MRILTIRNSLCQSSHSNTVQSAFCNPHMTFDANILKSSWGIAFKPCQLLYIRGTWRTKWTSIREPASTCSRMLCKTEVHKIISNRRESLGRSLLVVPQMVLLVVSLLSELECYTIKSMGLLDMQKWRVMSYKRYRIRTLLFSGETESTSCIKVRKE